MVDVNEAFVRLAERGPHRDPDLVINTAIATFEPRTAASRRRPALVGSVLAAVAVLATGAVLATADTTPGGPAPSAALSMSAEDRSAAVASCRQPPDADEAIVDRRRVGYLIGRLAPSGQYVTCVPGHESGVPASPDGWPAVTLPVVSADRPIAVIDAKAPDGNMIDGNETTWVWGLIAPGVARVVVSSPSGVFEATIEGRLFAAWWQGNDGDRTLVRALDANGDEIAFLDQLNCVPNGELAPRFVVRGQYVDGGCIGGADAAPGAGVG